MGLIAWYKLDGNANDSIGQNNGTPNNITWADGKIGQCANCEDIGYIDLGNVDSIDFQPYQSFSLGGWIKVTETYPRWHSPTEQWLNTTGTFVGRGSMGGSVGIGVQTSWDDTGDPNILPTPTSYSFLLGSRGVNQITYWYTFTLNIWYHLFFVYTPGVQYSYVNGLLVDTRNNAVGVDGSFSGNWSIFSESAVPGGNGTKISGLADDVRIYDHALSPKEAKELSRAKVLHYKFNEDDRIMDNSGYENHGTNYGATFTTDCKIGSGCYEFDGIDDRISTEQIFYDDLNQEWTVCGWVYMNDNTIGHQFFNNFNRGNKLVHSGSNGRALLYGNSGDNDHYTYSENAMVENQWFHIAYVYRTSDRTCIIYLNGEFDKESTNWSEGEIPDGFSINTVFGENFLGKLDDIRIYATVLSADEIKEIYQQRASLDNQGNFYSAGEMKEGVNVLEFDGVDDYVDCGKDPAHEFSSGQSFTIEWWQKTTQVDNGAFIGKGYSTVDGVGQDRPWYLSRPTNTYSEFYLRDSNGNNFIANGSTTTADGNWHHVAGVYDANNAELRLYVDSQLEDIVGNVNQDAYGTNNGHLILGEHNNHNYDGKLNEVRIWNTAITQQQIQDNMNKRLEGDESGLVAYYPMNEGTGTTVYDESINSNNGTVYGAIWTKSFVGIGETLSIQNNGNLTNTIFSECGITNGLVGWWPLDGHTRDISINRNDGINYGATVTTGLDGQMAYEFDGIDDYISHEIFSFTEEDSWSWGAWIYFEEHEENPNYVFMTADGSNGICFMVNGNYRFAFRTTHPDHNYTYWSIDSIVPYFDNWSYVIFVSTGDTLTLYINGEQFEETRDFPIRSRHSGIAYGNLNLSYMFKGLIQDVRIYNRALSAEEIKILYDLTGGSDINKMKQTQNKLHIKNQFKEI